VVGSLLLGLWTEDGRLQHVGVAASFPMARRASLMDELAPYREGVQDHPWAGDADAAGAEGRRLPGATSRWTGGKDLSFVPLRPELVVEVGYDHLEGDRFRHTAQFKRWRPDREAASCTYAQLDEPVGYRLSDVLRPV
jgi:ATP-dependent DNA ligase